MPTIHVNVRNRVATANGDSRIINGNSDYSIEFDFDAEWSDLNNKIGIFAYNDAAAHKWAYQPVMFSGNTCAVPILRDIHCVYVGVTAGNVRVTTPAKVQCRLSISDYADTEEPPSADIWGQILAKLDELQAEIDEIKAGGAGGGGAEVYYAELDGEYPSYTLSAETPLADIAKAYAANKAIVCRCEIGGMTATLPLFVPMPERNAWFFSGAGALDEQYPAQTFTVAITPFGVEAEQRLIAAQTALDAVTATANEAVLYTPQKLENEQKRQARKNIGATDISLNVTGATVGQTIKVKAVDADGKPTAWEAVDMAAGEVWETLAETTLEEESVPILDIGAMASSFSRLRFYFTFPIVESVEKVNVSLSIPNSTTGPQYDVASIKRGDDKSESWAFIDFYPLIYNGICYMSMIESAKAGITNKTTQQFQYNSYDYYRISEARYVRTSKPLPTGATITIMGVRK